MIQVLSTVPDASPFGFRMSRNTQRNKKNMGEEDKDENEKLMKQRCSSKLFDDCCIFLKSTEEKWVLKRGARPAGDASAM